MVRIRKQSKRELEQISVAVMDSLGSMNNQKEIELFEGQSVVYMHMFGYQKTLCLKWAVQLGIPNIIHNHSKPITLYDLVSTLQIPPSKAAFVQRLMRFLAHNGIFDIHESQEDHELTYSLTPASKLLVNGSDYCLSPMVLLNVDPLTIDIYHHLGEWIRKEEVDRTLIETAVGTSVWGFLEKEPAYLSLFNEAMASDSRIVNLTLKNCTSVFEELDSIVDVGGGTGTTARTISEAFPKLKCVVFDLPHVIANLTGTNNLSFVGGDMFTSIPQADAVLLKCILHDWNDETCIKILEKCKYSISSRGNRGKVIIIDAVINEKLDDRDTTQRKFNMDISMLANNGKERTEEEWKQLFIEAGFKHYKIFPGFGFRSLIELYP